ncbi:hypothetical protein Hanom_Chr05g00389611 [Helianthus anomalus]
MASGAREPKVSKAKGIKTCWFSAQALACLSTFFDSVFLAASPATNPFSLKPTKGETPVRSTQEVVFFQILYYINNSKSLLIVVNNF